MIHGEALSTLTPDECKAINVWIASLKKASNKNALAKASYSVSFQTLQKAAEGMLVTDTTCYRIRAKIRRRAEGGVL